MLSCISWDSTEQPVSESIELIRLASKAVIQSIRKVRLRKAQNGQKRTFARYRNPAERRGFRCLCRSRASYGANAANASVSS